MNKLYGTASVNGTQETAEGINTNNWPNPGIHEKQNAQ